MRTQSQFKDSASPMMGGIKDEGEEEGSDDGGGGLPSVVIEQAEEQLQTVRSVTPGTPEINLVVLKSSGVRGSARSRNVHAQQT